MAMELHILPSNNADYENMWFCRLSYAEYIFDEILDYIKIPKMNMLYEHLSAHQNKSLCLVLYLDEYPREDVIELKRAAGEALEYLRTDGPGDYKGMEDALSKITGYTEELITRIDGWGY